MHAKYECSIFNTPEDMSQVKVFVTDRQRDRRTDRRVLMSPAFAKAQGTKNPEIFGRSNSTNTHIQLSIILKVHLIRLYMGYGNSLYEDWGGRLLTAHTHNH